MKEGIIFEHSRLLIQFESEGWKIFGDNFCWEPQLEAGRLDDIWDSSFWIFENGNSISFVYSVLRKSWASWRSSENWVFDRTGFWIFKNLDYHWPEVWLVLLAILLFGQTTWNDRHKIRPWTEPNDRVQKLSYRLVLSIKLMKLIYHGRSMDSWVKRFVCLVSSFDTVSWFHLNCKP